MGVRDIQDWNVPYEYMSRLLNVWGQPCTVFVPTNIKEMGYENMSPEFISQTTGVTGAGTTYKRFNTIIFINFNIKKSVFYHFNYFPDDKDELVTAVLPKNDVVLQDAYIRTAQTEQVSKWGDLLFKVVSVKDDGMYSTLKRVYFLRPVVDSELHNLLTLGESGILTI